MADFFKNNPMALRNCIRFEILQGTPIEKAYSNFCSVIGEEVIDYKKFKIRFNHFSKKKFKDKEGENSCAKILRDDKYALRVCILYESLKYQKDKSSIPIFEVFVSFCKVIGVEDVLNYPEFEFWFYRFLNGEFDLNYERDEDKKIYELMDMPLDVMKNIVEYLDIFDRVKLAKTSRSLQTFVEDQKLFQQILELFISHRRGAHISFDNLDYFEYTSENDNCVKHYKKRKTFVRGAAFWKQALLDFKDILKNPKLHLDILEIYLDLENDHKIPLDDLEDALKFNHYLNVKNVFLKEYSWGLLAKVLPFLKPEYLTLIYIDSYNLNEDSMEELFEMEQWKQAKCFVNDGGRFIWPLRHLYHFEEFTVLLERFSVEEVRQMKEILFASPNFEECYVLVIDNSGANAIMEEFGDYLLNEEDSPELKKTYHYPIPNSTEYFEIKVGGWTLEVQRQKR